MRHLVVGLGEVGSALKKVLEEKFEVDGVDLKLENKVEGHYKYIHICIPWSEKFIEICESYKKYLVFIGESGVMIVHSSVPVGTCRQLGVVHSPIRGIHPKLYEGIKTFTKFFGGPRGDRAAQPFKELGMSVFCVPKSDETEALKLWDTTYYGWNIIFMHLLKKWCDEKGLDFGFIYGISNESYNDGYGKLGRFEFIRPDLTYMPGKIGGHCIIPNAEFLDSEIAKFILEKNKEL